VFRARHLALIALALPVLGCSSAPSPSPIAVSGAPSSIAALAGRWAGDYRVSDGGRHGVITFDLGSGDSLATGSVIMQPLSQTTAEALAPRGDLPHPAGAGLSVRFVQAENGMVRGKLDPYTDPECACTVITEFEGRQKGDRIEGTFTIRNTLNGATRAGTWTVARQP
jgi:hypothetical protein